ncbi:hypothetical protein GRI89_09370 [Altererythrobacter salegens]|uniref:UPF0386 protein GRI89_09370 n=1 Tax=Croceibacterium salegens TaxID=1737568 RepID=A0A6I4SXI9_9SPHN|nr:YjhX family toxin [Croceibacterium salegens]MXO59747.1 hypothetical protein [Croceibacterium salegens]
MNISKPEQRTLHALAQGGHIAVLKDHTKFLDAECYTRDGYRLVDCRLATFKRLKKRGFIMSMDGQPYRITRAGLAAVRAQLDNR